MKSDAQVCDEEPEGFFAGAGLGFGAGWATGAGAAVRRGAGFGVTAGVGFGVAATTTTRRGFGVAAAFFFATVRRAAWR